MSTACQPVLTSTAAVNRTELTYTYARPLTAAADTLPPETRRAATARSKRERFESSRVFGAAEIAAPESSHDPGNAHGHASEMQAARGLVVLIHRMTTASGQDAACCPVVVLDREEGVCDRGSARATGLPENTNLTRYVRRRDAKGLKTSPGACARAPTCGGARSALPGGRGLLDQGDRGLSRAVAGDRQGVLLRPHGREGSGGQGALPGGVPRLRRVHAAAEREGRRLRVLQGVPPGRDRASVDA